MAPRSPTRQRTNDLGSLCTRKRHRKRSIRRSRSRSWQGWQLAPLMRMQWSLPTMLVCGIIWHPAARPVNGQTTLAAYAQGSVIGSGVSGDHVHVPGNQIIDNQVLNSQYQSAPQYSAPAAQPYEQIPMTSVQPGVQQNYSSVPSAQSSCPACNSGHCGNSWRWRLASANDSYSIVQLNHDGWFG